jgi:hypothetical protein
MDSASIKRVGIEKAQNFMRQYRDPESRELKKLSANQFMDVWSHYDKDGEKVIRFFICHACALISFQSFSTKLLMKKLRRVRREFCELRDV